MNSPLAQRYDLWASPTSEKPGSQCLGVDTRPRSTGVPELRDISEHSQEPVIVPGGKHRHSSVTSQAEKRWSQEAFLLLLSSEPNG